MKPKGKTLLRWAVLLLAGLALLIALFYAEENWRGKRAWENFKREWEAKGEHFDFNPFVPKPVPDEQNFALTPIVAITYDYMLDRHGRERKPHRTNVVQRLYMDTHSRSGLDNDYLYTNPIGYGDWRVGKPADLKSWQQYYRAMSSKTNEFKVPTTPQSPAADVLLALSKYDSDIEEFRAASRLTNSRFPLNYDAKLPQPVFLMHLAPLKYCCQTLQLRAIAELENNESQQAMDDVLLSMRLVDSIRTEPFAYSHNNRADMVNMVIQAIWEGLAKKKWSEAQLLAIEQELGKLDFLADCQWSLRCARNESLATADYWINQRSYQLVRQLVHDLANSGLHSLESDEENARFERKVSALAWFYHLMPNGWYYQNELIIAKYYQEHALQVTDPANRLFSSQKLGAAGAFVESLPKQRWNFLARRYSGAAAFSIIRKLVHTQETIDLARVACALERCRLVQGEYPERLEALAPRYISQVPHDIIGGQPLHYRRTPAGKFLLYSVGWNEKDDGGVCVLREHSSHFVDDAKSDWVWRCPEQ